MKLSTAQEKALNSLNYTDWRSAFSISARITTLQALQSRGLVESKGWGEPGSFSMEQTHIKWRRIEQVS